MKPGYVLVIAAASGLSACLDDSARTVAQPNPASFSQVPLRADDEYAKLRLNINPEGYVSKCVVEMTNISSVEKRFWVCNAFYSGFHVTPFLQDGKRVAGVIERRVMLPGKATRADYDRLRREAAHPAATGATSGPSG